MNQEQKPKYGGLDDILNELNFDETLSMEEDVTPLDLSEPEEAEEETPAALPEEEPKEEPAISSDHTPAVAPDRTQAIEPPVFARSRKVSSVRPQPQAEAQTMAVEAQTAPGMQDDQTADKTAYPDGEEVVYEEYDEYEDEQPERTNEAAAENPSFGDRLAAAFNRRKELPEHLIMPKFRRNILRRVPKRIYHRGRLFSFVYVLTTMLLCVFIAVMFLRVFNDVLAFSTESRAITITIDKDDTIDDVADKMVDAGLIRYGWLMSYVANFEGETGPYQEGTHTLNDDMNYMQLLDEIAVKPVARETVWVTFTEGMTIDEIALLLEEKGVCKAEDFKTAAKEDISYGYDFEAHLSNDKEIYYPLEGFFFPDTYQFYTNETPANVINKVLKNFQNKIETVEGLMKQMGLTQHQTITLASLIEGEASGDPENMKIVSSVYWNRLNNTDVYPRLQCDPTRDYANQTILMAGNSITHKDLAAAYNTYESEGLPPGPINNPGMDAIMAALQPETTPYYYFCSNLRTGEFYYAENLADHEQNVTHIDD
ncbi:MAG: endolytic transglycosylase MltG [Erysipelotrichaceae bacterium]|nr:endolytic transglycosylase MltG [Erysipelotrichaceae bacterium]